MCNTGDVLERNTLRALGHQLGVAFGGPGIAEEHGAKPSQPHTKQVLRQQLGVHPGAGHTRCSKNCRGFTDGFREGHVRADRHRDFDSSYSPIASRRACSSISMADWMTGSKSPFIT